MALRVAEPAIVATPAASRVAPCPLCEHDDSDVFLGVHVPRGPAAGDYALRRCGACGFVYTDPRPPDAVLTRLYDADFYFSTGWPLSAIAELVIRRIQRTRQRRVERWVPGGTLLDIGSGDGRFVDHMAGEGWDATGIDFSPAATRLARSRGGGGRFLCGSLFEQCISSRSVDVVTLWQVLEHIGEPRAFLACCHGLMRPGGVLIAAVPNIDGLSARLAGDHWWGLDVPRHLVHYSADTLCRALVRGGFTVARVNHLSLQYDPYGLLHSTLDRVFTRRHFLSDFAKQQVGAGVPAGEVVCNVAALAVLGPVLAPLCLAASVAGSCCGRGGFIEVYARRG